MMTAVRRRVVFDDYLAYVDQVSEANPLWRCGQAHFNALSHVRPDLAVQVGGTPRDPFHLDERLPGFIAFVRENW